MKADMATSLCINCQSIQVCTSIPLAVQFCSPSQVATHQQVVCKLSPAGFPRDHSHLSKHSIRTRDCKLSPEFSVICSVSGNAGVGERSGVIGELVGVSTASETQVLERKVEVSRDEQRVEHQQKDDILISVHGWEVVRIDHNDIDLLKQFAHVQAETFHVTTAFFNDFLFAIFKGEVLGSILHKIRHATPKRYACLAAIPDCLQLAKRRIVGVVDAAAMADRDVLRRLPGVDEYLYISGMAVDSKYRRQKVATALLQSCDLTAVQWGFEVLVLQAYEDDTAARSLYSRAGYTVISADPLWRSKWLGRRRRVILAKKVSSCAANGQIC